MGVSSVVVTCAAGVVPGAGGVDADSSPVSVVKTEAATDAPWRSVAISEVRFA